MHIIVNDGALCLDFDKHLNEMPNTPVDEQSPPPRPATPDKSPLQTFLRKPRAQAPVLAMPVAAVQSASKRRVYTPEVDNYILHYVNTTGTHWRDLSRRLSDAMNLTISDDAIRNRWLRLVRIELCTVRPRPSGPSREVHVPWTQRDDEIIAETLCTHGRDWSAVSERLENKRTPHACRNRANRIGLISISKMRRY